MSNHIEIRDVTATIVYVDPFPNSAADETVMVDCGRCGGTGYVPSNVDGGICYDCRGAKGSLSTVAAERKKAKGKIAYRRSVERKLIKKQEFHNAQMEAAEAAFPILAGWHEAMSENNFLMDLWTKAFDYELSEKQVAAAAKTMQAKVDRTAQRQAEHDALSPAPEGKQRIVGEVVSIQLREGNYGSVWKMIVLDDRQFKVWTTAPAALWDQLNAEVGEDVNPDMNSLKGRRVEFNATIEPSEDDNTFAFAKRPTKAVLQAAGTEAAPAVTETEAAPEEAAQAPAAAAPAAETLTHKDGTAYTFISVSKDGLCYRVKDAAGKASYKRISHFI